METWSAELLQKLNYGYIHVCTCINTAWKDVISFHYNGTCTTMCCIPLQSVKQLIPMLMTAPIHYMYYDFPHPFTSLFILQVHVQYMYWYILPYMDNPTSIVDEWTILTLKSCSYLDHSQDEFFCFWWRRGTDHKLVSDVHIESHNSCL